MNIWSRRILAVFGSMGALLGATLALGDAMPAPQPAPGVQEALGAQIQAQEETGAKLRGADSAAKTALASAAGNVRTLQGTLAADRLQAKRNASRAAAVPAVQSVSGASGGGDDGGGGSDN